MTITNILSGIHHQLSTVKHSQPSSLHHHHLTQPKITAGKIQKIFRYLDSCLFNRSWWSFSCYTFCYKYFWTFQMPSKTINEWKRPWMKNMRSKNTWKLKMQSFPYCLISSFIPDIHDTQNYVLLWYNSLSGPCLQYVQISSISDSLFSNSGSGFEGRGKWVCIQGTNKSMCDEVLHEKIWLFLRNSWIVLQGESKM